MIHNTVIDNIIRENTLLSVKSIVVVYKNLPCVKLPLCETHGVLYMSQHCCYNKSARKIWSIKDYKKSEFPICKKYQTRFEIACFYVNSDTFAL